MKKTNLFLVPFLTLFSYSAWANQCVQLFEAQSKLTISELASLPTEEQIQLQIDALVELFYKIQTKGFPNDDQLNQSVVHFNAKLKQIIAIDAKYEYEFKKRFFEATQKMKTEQSDVDKKEKEEIAKKERIIFETTDPVYLSKKMILHEIHPGKFFMGFKNIESEITKPFAMMDSKMTQMMWARLKIAIGEKNANDLNPSFFKTGSESMLVKNIDGSGVDVQMKPDHPVEQVSWNDVKKLINGLNRLSNSDDEKTQELLKKIIPDHKKGDRYDFPTDAQWEFVMQNRGNTKKMYFDRDDNTEILDHAWFAENSKSEEYPEGSTHAVATKKARLIDRGDGVEVAFYDLEGNLSEWTKHATREILSKSDPTGTPCYRIRGCSWNGPTPSWHWGRNSDGYPKTRYKGVGIRLVRIRL